MRDGTPPVWPRSLFPGAGQSNDDAQKDSKKCHAKSKWGNKWGGQEGVEATVYRAVGIKKPACGRPRYSEPEMPFGSRHGAYTLGEDRFCELVEELRR